MNRRGWILVFLMAIIAIDVGVMQAMARAPDPMATTCGINATRLPQLVPRLLVLNVTDESSYRVPASIEARIQRELADALNYYPFNASILVVTNDSTRIPSGDNDIVHVAQVQLWFHHALPSRWFETTVGRMCGNLVLVEETSDASYNVWSLKHELGHYFGLPHYDGTYMNNQGDRTARHDRRVPCQDVILSKWVPGVPYVPHWATSASGECAFAQSWLSRLNPFAS